MQNENHRFAPSPLTGPACDAPGLDDRSDYEKHSGAAPLRRGDPRHQRESGDGHRRHIEGGERRRELCAARPRQPIVRKARRYSATHQYNEPDDGRDTEPQTVVGRATDQHLDLEEYVGERQEGDQDRDFQVSPVFAGDDLPHDDSGESGQIDAVDHCGCGKADAVGG
jgi:hypothetical protein